MDLDTIAAVLLGIAVIGSLLSLSIFVTVLIRIRKNRKELKSKLDAFHAEFGYRPW